MKVTATLLAAVGLLISTQANAYWTTDVSTSNRLARPYGQHDMWDRDYHRHPANTRQARSYGRHRHVSRGGGLHISGDCWVAARKGGPCGCMAMRIVGITDRRFWLVRNWLVFPRTSAHVGAAAIWGSHHVEIVTSVNGDGTVSTTGSVGFSRVPISRLHFVEPHAVYGERYAERSTRSRRVWRGRRHYAGA